MARLREGRLGGPLCAVVLATALLGFGAPAHADKIDDAQAAFGDFREEEALKLLNEVVAESADNPQLMATALFNRGEVQAWLRKTDNAIADFTAALAIQKDPGERALTLVARAEAYGRKNMSAEAIADYDASLKLAPGQTGVLTARGNLHQKIGNTPAALADFEAELKLRPTYNKALAGRALILNLPLPPDPGAGRY